MKKVYSLSEIDCVVCAGKLEDKIKKLDGVNSASLNFFAGKLVVEIDDNNAENISNNIIKTIKKFDRNIKVEY